jgi:hypothetical protein
MFGAVNFNTFLVWWGPEGLYSFKIVSKNFENVESDVFQIYIWTAVNDLLIEDVKFPKTVYFDKKPYPVQPVVKVLDVNG